MNFEPTEKNRDKNRVPNSRYNGKVINVYLVMDFNSKDDWEFALNYKTLPRRIDKRYASDLKNIYIHSLWDIYFVVFRVSDIMEVSGKFFANKLMKVVEMLEKGRSVKLRVCFFDNEGVRIRLGFENMLTVKFATWFKSFDTELKYLESIDAYPFRYVLNRQNRSIMYPKHTDAEYDIHETLKDPSVPIRKRKRKTLKDYGTDEVGTSGLWSGSGHTQSEDESETYDVRNASVPVKPEPIIPPPEIRELTKRESHEMNRLMSEKFNAKLDKHSFLGGIYIDPSKVLENAKHPKKNIEDWGILVSTRKKDYERDRSLLKSFLKQFIPGDTKAIKKMRKEVLERWLAAYSIPKSSLKKVNKRVKSRMKKIKKFEKKWKKGANVDIEAILSRKHVAKKSKIDNWFNPNY